MKLKAIFFLFTIAVLHASDLTTRDGKVYKNFTVLSHDDGFLTIMYEDGGGKIPLSSLPDALQKQYGYDPAKAAAAKTADDLREKQDALAIEKERLRVAAQRQKDLADTNGAAATESSWTAPAVTKKPALSTEDIAALQTQIDALNADIAFMEKDQNKLSATNPNVLRANGATVTKGAYADRIVDDQKQVAVLQSQMAGN